MLSFEDILKRLTADDREKNFIPKSGRAIPKKYCSFIQTRDESINSMVTKLYLTLAMKFVIETVLGTLKSASLTNSETINANVEQDITFSCKNNKTI